MNRPKLYKTILFLAMMNCVYSLSAQEEVLNKHSYGIRIFKTNYGLNFVNANTSSVSPNQLSDVQINTQSSVGVQLRYGYNIYKRFSLSSGIIYLNHQIKAQGVNLDIDKFFGNVVMFNSIEFPLIAEYRIILKPEIHLIPYLGYVFMINAISPQMNVFHVSDPNTGYEDRMYIRKSRNTGHAISYGLELENDFKKGSKLRVGIGAIANIFSVYRVVSTFNDPFPSTRLYRYTSFDYINNFTSITNIDIGYITLNLTYILPAKIRK
jgi:hypothetical protein